jgi:hypothetical protein
MASKTLKGVQSPKPVLVNTPQPNALSGTYLDFPVLSDLPSAIAEYRRLILEIARVEPLQVQRKEVAALIEALLLAANAKSVTCGEFRATRVETQGRKTLSADLLLQNGCDADIIAKAYTFGKPSSSVRVTRMDDEKEQASNGYAAADGYAHGARGRVAS